MRPLPHPLHQAIQPTDHPSLKGCDSHVHVHKEFIMKCQVLKEDIVEGVQLASNIIPAKTGTAYLRTIWLETRESAITIMATDSNIEFTGTYPAQILEPGRVGIHGKKFSDLIRKLPPGELTFEANEGDSTILIHQGKKKYKLPLNNGSWFQEFQPMPEEGQIVWPGDLLQNVIERISFCINDSEDSGAMNCIKFTPLPDGVIEVCGMNGHQFGLLRFSIPDTHATLGEAGVLIAKKDLGEIGKWLRTEDISINLTEKKMFLRSAKGHETLSVPRRTNAFPDYRNFIESYENTFRSTLEVDKYELTDALERILLFNTQSSRSTYLHFSPNELGLSCHGQEFGEGLEIIGAQFQGDLDMIAIPTRILLEIMSHFTSNTITFQLAGPLDPCKITGPDDPDYFVITMPVEITEDTYYTEEEDA
jgi:DNA polymerase-3 subunit beta